MTRENKYAETFYKQWHRLLECANKEIKNLGTVPKSVVHKFNYIKDSGFPASISEFENLLQYVDDEVIEHQILNIGKRAECFMEEPDFITVFNFLDFLATYPKDIINLFTEISAFKPCVCGHTKVKVRTSSDDSFLSYFVQCQNCYIITNTFKDLKDAKEVWNDLIDKLSFKKYEDINASEALYGFAAWLTSRSKSVTIGAKHDAAIVADLVKEWSEYNNLEPVRDIYPKNIKHPAPPKRLKIVIAGSYIQYERYLKSNGISPQEARYVYKLEHLHGLRDVEIVTCGQWWLNPCSSASHTLDIISS